MTPYIVVWCHDYFRRCARASSQGNSPKIATFPRKTPKSPKNRPPLRKNGQIAFGTGDGAYALRKVIQCGSCTAPCERRSHRTERKQKHDALLWKCRRCQAASLRNRDEMREML